MALRRVSGVSTGAQRFNPLPGVEWLQSPMADRTVGYNAAPGITMQAPQMLGVADESDPTVRKTYRQHPVQALFADNTWTKGAPLFVLKSMITGAREKLPPQATECAQIGHLNAILFSAQESIYTEDKHAAVKAALDLGNEEEAEKLLVAVSPQLLRYVFPKHICSNFAYIGMPHNEGGQPLQEIEHINHINQAPFGVGGSQPFAVPTKFGPAKWNTQIIGRMRVPNIWGVDAYAGCPLYLNLERRKVVISTNETKKFWVVLPRIKPATLSWSVGTMLDPEDRHPFSTKPGDEDQMWCMLMGVPMRDEKSSFSALLQKASQAWQAHLQSCWVFCFR